MWMKNGAFGGKNVQVKCGGTRVASSLCQIGIGGN